jgi:mannosyl-oligosaccharide alpha-1,2-mannosidase
VDAGWRIFQALEEHERQPGGGYTGLKDVRVLPGPVRDDTQQSFFLAETLKYLYLLFADSGALDLDAWVLNTEAHPLRVTVRDTSLLAEAADSSSSGSGDARPL